MSLSMDDGCRLLYKEARLLDERRWDEWLALYCEDCEYWVPSWRNDEEATEDPRRELSLIYYANRSGLEDRIFRIRSRRSLASALLPRTCHSLSNIELLEEEGERLVLRANWTVHRFLPRERSSEVFFGSYTYGLRRVDAGWRIARKKILLLNDYLPGQIDLHSL